MFRFIFGFVAIVAALALAGLVVSVLGAVVGFLVWPLLILVKVAFFVLLFGFFASKIHKKGFGPGRHHHRYGGWQAPSRWEHDSAEDRPSRDDRFEDWHRMAHAREEVDRDAPTVD